MKVKFNKDNFDDDELYDNEYDEESQDDDEEDYEYESPWYVKFGKIAGIIALVLVVLIGIRIFTGGGSTKSAKTEFLTTLQKQFVTDKLAKKYEVTMTQDDEKYKASGEIMVADKQANITFKTEDKEHVVTVDGDKVYQNKKLLKTEDKVSTKSTKKETTSTLEDFLKNLDEKKFAKTDDGYDLTLSTDETKELFSSIETDELKQFKLYKNHIKPAKKLETKISVTEKDIKIKVDYKAKQAFKLNITVSDTKFKKIKTVSSETKESSKDEKSSVDISSITKSSSKSTAQSTEPAKPDTEIESQAIKDLREYFTNDADGFTEEDQKVIDHQKELEKQAQ